MGCIYTVITCQPSDWPSGGVCFVLVAGGTTFFLSFSDLSNSFMACTSQSRVCLSHATPRAPPTLLPLAHASWSKAGLLSSAKSPRLRAASYSSSFIVSTLGSPMSVGCGLEVAGSAPRPGVLCANLRLTGQGRPNASSDNKPLMRCAKLINRVRRGVRKRRDH